MVYAQIKDGVIVNVIVLDDPTLEPVFLKGFDALERIDHLKDDMPKLGDLHDGDKFIPAGDPTDLQVLIQNRVVQLENEVRVFIGTLYPSQDQSLISSVYAKALASGDSETIKAVEEMFDWITQAVKYRDKLADQIKSAKDSKELAQIQWNLCDSLPPAPQVTVASILALSDPGDQ